MPRTSSAGASGFAWPGRAGFAFLAFIAGFILAKAAGHEVLGAAGSGLLLAAAYSLGLAGSRFGMARVSPSTDRTSLLEAANRSMREEVEARIRLEDALRRSEERYRAFVRNSSEGIWRFELEEPIPVDAPEDEQIARAYRHGYLAECNDAMARMYGRERAEEMTGARLGDLLVRTDARNVEFLREFIRSGYRLMEVESHEVDKEGRSKYFLNSFMGVVENGHVVRAWGTQTDVTVRRETEDVRQKLNEEMEKRVLDRTVELMRTNRSLYEEIAQRKNAEMELLAKTEALRESERRWRTLVEKVRLAVVGLDGDGRITFANAFFRELTGYGDKDLRGRDWFTDFLPAASRDKVRAALRDAAEKPSHGYYQSPLLTKSGEERMISWSNVRLHTEEGAFAETLSIGEDITDRLRTIAALRDSEEKFRSIAESAQDGILLIEDTGKIRYWNKSARDVFGYEDREVVGHSVDMLLPERYRSAVFSAGRQLFSDGGPDMRGKTMDLAGLRKGGREVPLEISFAVWSTQSRRYFACILRDVTERKIAEAHLRFQARILSEVKDAVVVVDNAGCVSYWNRGAESLYGHRLVDALGRQWEELVRTQWTGDDEKYFQDALNGKQGHWQGELLQHTGRGQPIYTACSVGILRDGRGEPAGRLITARDVTERRKLEAVALQNQKMAAMGQMASGVAHELKAPLGVIYGYAGVLETKLSKDRPLLEKIELIKKQALRCSNLINNLLDFARQHHMTLTADFELDAAVASAFSILQPYSLQKAVTLVREVPSEPLTLHGNSEMLEQVIINLAINGIDATPSGGKLTVSAQKIPGPTGFQARIAVADTGKGIPPEIEEHLFEAFVTTKDPGKGTGLGLWLVREIVTSMGGTIECRNEPGRGATFLVTLPLAAAVVERRAAGQS
jgi:PAS domain S-box-containing protein